MPSSTSPDMLMSTGIGSYNVITNPVSTANLNPGPNGFIPNNTHKANNGLSIIININSNPGGPVRLPDSGNEDGTLPDNAAANAAEDDGRCHATKGNASSKQPTTTTTNITAMTLTHLTVSVPLLSLLVHAPTLSHSLLHPLLTAHLRSHHVTLLPCLDDGSIHLAANYHNAGTHPLATSPSGPDAPFVSYELPRDVLAKGLRSFTLVAPTAEGWCGDGGIVRQRQGAFLEAASTVPGGEQLGLAELEEAWFCGVVAAAEHGAKRRKWVRAVSWSLRELGCAMAGALSADGVLGEEARRTMRGEVVLQEWCDGWGDKCGADVAMARKVVEVVGEMEERYGRRMQGRLVVAEGTAIGTWGEVGAKE